MLVPLSDAAVGGQSTYVWRRDSFPASDLEEPSHRCIERDPAPSTAYTNLPHRRAKIPGVVPLIGGHDRLIELLVDLPKPAAHSVWTMLRTATST
jgi:hypothetical protein